jgi:hypothetical protein
MNVTKRDGRIEEFIPEKVVVSAIKSGASSKVARDIARDVENISKDGISTKEIKRMVLDGLKERNSEWEKNWLTYDRAVKKREE